MATSTVNTIPAPYIDRSITIDWNGKPLTWRPRDNFPPPPQSTSNLQTPATKQKQKQKQKNRDRIRKLIRKIMETLHIRSPQRGGTKVIVTGGTPPQRQSFFSNWMTGPGASANSKSPPHRDFSRESTYASQEAKKGGAPHSYTFGCQGCTMLGARHDHGICTRSSNVGECPVVEEKSSIACLKGKNASTTCLNPLNGPKSQQAQALLARSEEAISEQQFLGPLEFEKDFYTQAEKYLDIVEEGPDASLVNPTAQDSSTFSLGGIVVPASTIPPKRDKVADSQSRWRFIPSVDRISEKSNGFAEHEDIPHYTPFRTSSKRQEGVFDPQSSPTSGFICPPNSRLNSPESLEAQRHPETISGASSFEDIDVVDFALPSLEYPQKIPQPITSRISELREELNSCFISLCSYPPSSDAPNGPPISTLAEPMTNSQSFEDIDEYLKKHQSLSLCSMDSRYTNDPSKSLLFEKSFDMGSPPSGLDSYEFSRPGKLSATVQYDSDDEGRPSIPGSFTMATPSRIRAELLQWELAKNDKKIGGYQSFENIDEIMARPETAIERSLSEASLDQSIDLETSSAPIPIPGPRTFPASHDPMTSWEPLFSATPPMPGSWPSPFPSIPIDPLPPPNFPSSLSNSWQELPFSLMEPSSSVHLRGGGGGSANCLLHAKKYVPNIENGSRLLDKKISGCDSYFALGWGKGMTHREFIIMMEKRADREKEIEQEEQEKAEAEKKRKAEAGESAFTGVVNKVKAVFEKRGKEPVPDNAPGGVGAAV